MRAGCRWRRGSAHGHVAVEPVAIADTTGAGDALVAGAVGHLMSDPMTAAGAADAGMRAARALLAARGEEEERQT